MRAVDLGGYVVDARNHRVEHVLVGDRGSEHLVALFERQRLCPMRAFTGANPQSIGGADSERIGHSARSLRNTAPPPSRSRRPAIAATPNHAWRRSDRRM